MRRVLRQPKPGFDPVIFLSDTSQSETQETIETFFNERAEDDQILFLFSGYILQNGDNKLYFATPETAPDQHGRLIKSKTIPASFIQEVMDSSPARHQMVILDAYFRQTFNNQPVAGESPVDLAAQLGGAERIILSASAFTQHVIEPEELDVWSYCRYLAEGIETAAADTDNDGSIAPLDLHQYACRRLRIAAPAMQPCMYGNEALMTQPWFSVPANTPPVNYRKVLENQMETAEVNATGSMLLTGRTLLDGIRHSLGISSQESADIESRTLRPVRDYRQRLQAYQEQFSRITQGQDVANGQIRQYLKQIQQALCLMDKDTAAIDAVPHVTEQQRQREQYQRNLAQYEQVLLSTMQHQFPLTEGDRQLLQRLQQVLQLKDEDIAAIEQQLNGRMEHQDTVQPLQPPPVNTPPSRERSAPMPPPHQPTSPNSPQTTVQPPYASAQAPIQPPFPNAAFVQPGHPPDFDPLASEPMKSEHMKNVSYPVGMPVSAPETQPPPPSPPPDDSTAANAGQPPMNVRTQSPRKPYVALIIPGLLLAALLGSLVAYWSARGVNPFNSRNNQIADGSTQQTVPPLNQAAEQINLGVKAQEIGDLDGAINYFNQAIRLTEKQCVPTTNVSSTDCQVLARAYSNRSHAFFQQQNFPRAFEDANAAVVLDQNLAEARINLANARFKRGELPIALQDYDQALKLNLSNVLRAGIYNNRGNVLFSQQKTEAALKDYNEAIRLHQSYADAYFNRGLAHELLKNPSSAISDFQQAARFYRDQNAFNRAKDAEKRAQALQEQTPEQTPLPPAPSVGRQN